MRERGLKLDMVGSDERVDEVVPRAGTWIETVKSTERRSRYTVVPRAGTWIETGHIHS